MENALVVIQLIHSYLFIRKVDIATTVTKPTLHRTNLVYLTLCHSELPRQQKLDESFHM